MSDPSSTTTIGVLHPGAMGASVAAALRRGGADVVVALEGRSAASRARASAAGVRDVGSVPALAAAAHLVVSICPPAAAEAVAATVLDAGFGGTYVDANAVSPATAQRLARRCTAAGCDFVDGDVIGGPVAAGSGTAIYLSGGAAARVAALFTPGDPAVFVLGEDPTLASTLKMCYAAWTKGSAALLLAIAAVARRAGVEDALWHEWDRSQPGLAARLDGVARANAPKAWRFEGEMDEIAATFAAAGLPGGFGEAAAAVYRALAPFKDVADPAAGPVIDALARH
jgi:3-hydroxyisobutyrate dehydrogenase-like beta-hydroxyacid dehydrogenase